MIYFWWSRVTSLQRQATTTSDIQSTEKECALFLTSLKWWRLIPQKVFIFESLWSKNLLINSLCKAICWKSSSSIIGLIIPHYAILKYFHIKLLSQYLNTTQWGSIGSKWSSVAQHKFSQSYTLSEENSYSRLWDNLDLTTIGIEVSRLAIVCPFLF